MTDIALLFARDPFEHTDADIDAMIERFRAARHTFNSTPPGTAKPKLTKKEQEIAGAAPKLSINLELKKPS